MLGKMVARGAVWLVGARLMTKGLDLLAMLIVARILTPADFGLVALAATVLQVLDAATDFSLSNAIIQMRDPQKSAYDTAFTLNLLRGVGLALILVALAWPFAAIYNDHRLAPLMLVIALAPVFRGLISPRMARLARELQFRQAFFVEASGKIASFVASVAVAEVMHSYWALIAGLIAAPAISSLVSYRLAPYRPALGTRDGRAIFAFSGWLTLSQIVNMLNTVADRFIVGGKLGQSVLGQYFVGSELASVPTQTPIMPMMQALYAGFAKVSADRRSLAAAYITSQQLVTAVALPIGFVVSATSDVLIQVLLGPKWSSAALVIKLLAPIIAVQIMAAPVHSLCMASGHTRYIFTRDTYALCIRIPLMLLGMWAAGLIGLIGARVISGTVFLLLNLRVASHITGIGIVDQVWSCHRSLVAVLLPYSVVMTFNHMADMQGTIIWQITFAILGSGIILISYPLLSLALWLAEARPAGAEEKIARMIRQLYVRVRSHSKFQPKESI